MAPFCYGWGFIRPKVTATWTRQLTLYHSVPRNPWHSLYSPRKDERLSHPWSHPVALITGPLDRVSRKAKGTRRAPDFGHSTAHARAEPPIPDTAHQPPTPHSPNRAIPRPKRTHSTHRKH